LSGAIVSLVIAIVGVGGTLASAIFTQRLSQRGKQQELEHMERLRLSDREETEKRRKADQLHACYVRLNANDRNYRDALLAYAYALKANGVGEKELAELAIARRAQRDARAEAQMIVSEEVLEAESKVNNQLTIAFKRLKQFESQSDPNVRELLLDEIIGQLNGVIGKLSRVRVLMRMDLGVINKFPAWY
jgi:hypothetical protein